MTPTHAFRLLAIVACVACASPARGDTVTGATPDDPSRVNALLRVVDSLQTIGRWAESESLVVRARGAAETARSADSATIAHALYLEARARYGAKTLRDSVALRQVARSIGIRQRARPRDLGALAASHSLAGRILADTERPDSALHQFAASRAAVLERGGAGTDSLLARLALYRANAHRQLRQSDAAVSALEEALALETRFRGPETPAVAVVLNQLGGARVDQGRLDDARVALERSLAIQERAHGPQSYELVPSLILLSTVEHRTGDVAGSLDLLERGLAITRRRWGDTNIRVTPLLDNMALRQFDFGDAAGAKRLYEQSLRIHEATYGAGHSRTENTRVFLGAATAMSGDTVTALRHLTAALKALESRPPERNYILVYAYRWHAHVLAMQGRVDEARASLNRGLAVLQHTTEPPAEPLIDLSVVRMDVQRLANDPAGLDSTLRLAAAVFEGGGRRGSIIYTMWMRGAARAEEFLGRADSAWAHALEAERFDHARLVHNARALSDRRTLELAGGVGESLDLLIGLARTRGPAEHAVAWDRLIGWRGLVRDEAMRRRVPLAAAGDTALRAAHRSWLDAQRRHARLEVVALSGGNLPPDAMAKAQAEVEETERRYGARLEAAGLSHAEAPSRWSTVRAALAPGTALVSVVEAPALSDTARLLAFVAADRDAEPRLVDLGLSRPVRARVAAWRRSLATPPASRAAERECRRLGARVREATWDRLSAVVGSAREVVIVPDGPLVDLPWAALPMDDRAYLVESEPRVRVVDAERALLAPAPPERHGLLAVGDPSFDDREGASLERPLAASAFRGPLGDCPGGDALRLAALPGARDEALRVADAWDVSHPDELAQRLIGAAAREDAFKRDAPGRAVIHIATHGVMLGDSCAPVVRGARGVGGVGPVTPSRPAARPAATAAGARPVILDPGADDASAAAASRVGRRVWIALAGANHARDAGADADEGLLTAGEVATLDLRGVRCVVLSACQSGVGVDWPREGSLGMQRAFRLAGARSVVASQWAIGDESTREWMLALYGNWSGGRTSVSEAMTAAGRAVLRARRDTGRSTHPFHWAAFTATGE